MLYTVIIDFTFFFLLYITSAYLFEQDEAC